MDDQETQMPPEAVTYHGNILKLHLHGEDAAFIRRSSLIFADGAFELTTQRIAKRRFNLLGIFSGQVRWANKFQTEAAPVTLMASRDFIGTVASIDVSDDTPVHIKPGLYIGHKGDLVFDTKRVAKKEFWTLTKVTGSGTVFIKLPGQQLENEMSQTPQIVDTNYVAAIIGAFEANGKVFTSKQLLKSGELENVKLKGDGMVVFQSENPGDASSGGGILSSIIDILPF